MYRPNPQAPFTQKVGPHELELEPPDLLHIRYDGDVELEHFKVFDAIITSFPSPTRIYILRDARRGGTAQSAARSDIAKNASMTNIAAVVTYGSSFQSRTVTQVLNTAMRRLHEASVNAVFFNSEAEARGWIAEHRNTNRVG